MTEQTTTPAPEPIPTPAPEPDPSPTVTTDAATLGTALREAMRPAHGGVEPKPYAPKPPKGTPDSGRWAVWDTTLERYVGPVKDSKPSQAEANKLAPNGFRLIEV